MYRHRRLMFLNLSLMMVVGLPAVSLASPNGDDAEQAEYLPGTRPEGSAFDTRSVVVRFHDPVSHAIRSNLAAGRSTVDTSGADAALDALNLALGVEKVSPVFAVRDSKTGPFKGRLKDDWRSGYFLVEFKVEIDVVAAVQQYRTLANVESAQLNYIYAPDLTPNDPSFSSQYAHQVTQAEAGWDIETGDPSVVIAVVGTGVQLDHPDLLSNIWENGDEIDGNLVDDDLNGFVDDRYGWDFSGNDNDPSPTSDHETNVAGVAAAVADNGQGIAGVTWNSGIMVLRVDYTSADVAAAIDYAADNGADVINMSFGNYDLEKYGPDTIVEMAVDDAYAGGIVLVATAGNNSIQTERYPGALDNVIATAATTIADDRAGFSNYGSWVSVGAPGASILTTTTGSAYETVNGTSFAAPYVAGLAALLLSKDPGLTPTNVRRRIEYSVDKISVDKLIGSGRVNVFNALSLTADPDLFAIIKSPLMNSSVSGIVEISGTAIGDQYELEIMPEGAGDWTQIGTGGDTYDDVLGSFDVEDYSEQRFDVRLTATRGAAWDEDTITIFASGGLLDGWPQTVSGAIVASPSYSDTDQDGYPEIFVGTNPGEVAGWQHDGSNVAGWPTSGGVYMFGSPAIGDVDGDGESEIFEGSYWTGYLYGWNHDGTSLTGWPQSVSAAVRAAPALADLDGDGVLDVIATGSSGFPSPSWVQVWRGNGTDLPGWPASIEYNSQAAPAVGDLDGDGDPEVFVQSWKNLYAFHHDGSTVSGWPQALSGKHNNPVLADLDGDGDEEVIVATEEQVTAYQGDGGSLWSTQLPGAQIGYFALALGDVDGDGLAEVCVGGDSGVLAILDDTGAVLPGFPISAGASDLQGCVMADIDDDGLQEAIVTSDDALIYAFDGDGSVPSGDWPRAGRNTLYSTAAIGDVDQDGLLDLMIGNEAGEFLVMRLDTPDHPRALHWPMHHGSERHTGRFAYTDSDDDGVIDDVERAAPNGGDGNGDGTADFQQANVASLPGKTGAGDSVTVELSGGCSTLTDVETYAEGDMPEPDPAHDYPLGLVGFTAPCAAATATVFFHGVSLSSPQYRKYGPSVPGDPATNTWYGLEGASFSTTTIDGQPVLRSTFSLVDGGLGDATAVDGQIVDPGGPVEGPVMHPVPMLGPGGLAVLAAGLLIAATVLLTRISPAVSEEPVQERKDVAGEGCR